MYQKRPAEDHLISPASLGQGFSSSEVGDRLEELHPSDESESGALPARPSISRFVPRTYAELERGDVIDFENGSRSLVVTCAGDTVECLCRSSTGALSYLELPRTTGLPLAVVERSPLPNLIRSAISREIHGSALNAQALREGDLLFYYANGDREEVVGIRDYGGLNHTFVTVQYKTDGQISVDGDRDFTSPPFPSIAQLRREVVRQSDILPSLIHSASREMTVSAGTVYECADGSRRLVLNRNDSSAAVVILRDDEITLESELGLELLQSPLVKPCGSAAHYGLIPGNFVKEERGSCAWSDIRPGDMIDWPGEGGYREEILSTSPGINMCKMWADSLRYYPDGRIELMRDQYHEDLELAGPNAPVVSRKDTGSKSQDGMKSERHPLQRAVSEELDRMECLAAAAVRSHLVSLRQSQTLGESASVAEPDPAYDMKREALLDDLKELHESRRRAEKAFDVLAGYAELALGTKFHYLSGLNEAASQVLETSGFERVRDRLEMMARELTVSVEAEAQPSSGAERDEFSKISGRPLQHLGATFTLCRTLLENVAVAPQCRNYSVLEVDRDAALLERVSALIKTAPKPEEHDKIPSWGTIAGDYTPEHLAKLVSQGLKLITIRERSHTLDKDAVIGVIGYYDPGNLPEEVQNFKEWLRGTANQGEIVVAHFLVVDPVAKHQGVRQALLDSLDVELQRTNAKIRMGWVNRENLPALLGILDSGDLMHAWYAPVSHTRGGDPVLWVGLVGAVHPDERRAWQEFRLGYRAKESLLGRLLNERAQELAQPSNISVVAERMVPVISQCEQPVLVRVSCGSGNMSAPHLEVIERVLLGGFNGFAGALQYEANELMERSTSGVVTGKILKCAAQFITSIAHKNRGGIYYGLVLETEEAQDCVFPGVNGGLPIRVINQEITIDKQTGDKVFAPYISVKQYGVRHCVTISGQSADPHIWDKGGALGMAVGDALESAKLRGGRAFRKVYVSGGGGGVIGREIAAFADHGWEVILIAGSGGATDRYINDAAWRAAHPNAHVVSSAQELNERLDSYGALREERRSRLTVVAR